MDIDVLEILSPPQRGRFEASTGLIKAPATLILPPEGRGFKRTLEESEMVVVFLHGLGGGRWSWGLHGEASAPEGIASQVMRSLWERGKKAVGLALAGLGNDGSELSPHSQEGITPGHYAQQLEETLRALGLWDGKRIVVIGHSIGAAAAWEFGSLTAKRSLKGKLPRLAVIALSPARAITESRLFTFGCHLSAAAINAGRWLSTPLQPLMRPLRQRMAALAASLKGLAQQGDLTDTLLEIEGVVLVGERDWVVRRGLPGALRKARSRWPVTILPGVGHDLLALPTIGLILAAQITKFFG